MGKRERKTEQMWRAEDTNKSLKAYRQATCLFKLQALVRLGPSAIFVSRFYLCFEPHISPIFIGQEFQIPQVFMGRRKISEDKTTDSRSEQTLFTFDEESDLAARIVHQVHIDKFHLCSNCPSVTYFLRDHNIFS